MPETILVPLSGETVNAGAATDGGGDWVGGRWQPGSRTRRGSLHDIRIKPSSVPEETAPQPVETPQYAQSYAPTYAQQTYDQQQVGYTQQENHMASNSFDRDSEPDDEYFDPYDTEQLGAFIQKQVQAALAPSRQQINDAELMAQHDRAFERFGSDSNFKTVMGEALENCLRDAKAGKPIDIERAYEAASESVSRRPGQRTAHLPSKAKTIKGLGALIEHNHKTGRARPYKGR